MKRFLITSTKFSGQAEIFYNDAEILCRIDCSDTNMSATVMHHFKNAVGVTIPMMGRNFSADTVIVEAEFEVSFDMFWKKYNKKINKARCMILWSKMNKGLQVQAFFGITGYDKY